MNFYKNITLLFASVILLAGCASNLTGDNYSAAEARKVQSVEFGRVIAERPVVIDGRQNGILGTAAGGILGGVIASNVGGGKGRDIATGIGAIIGGILGQQVEEKATRKQGQEITVQLDSGETLSIVQQISQANFFAVNDRVKVLQQGSTARVSY
ncbi:MAG: glycine zipper 2TM domain-containing protein [Oceanospirillaceae bacterium]|nr:glycine zipper 2TM domain-containing protein [Oceanospirillaceae bacterium]